MMTRIMDYCSFNDIQLRSIAVQLFDITCNHFLKTDSLHVNYDPFQFVNNNPNLFVDRTGNQPMIIAPGTPKEDVKKVFKAISKITNDRLNLDYNSEGDYHEISLRRLQLESRITKISGTGLVRNLISHHENRVIINFNNPLRIQKYQNEFLVAKKYPGKTVITYNEGIPAPHFFYLDPSDGRTFVSNSYLDSPMELNFYHELVHAYQNATEHALLPHDRYAILTRTHSPNSQHETNELIKSRELQAVGLNLNAEEPIDEVDFREPYSENQFRRELGLPLRIRSFYPDNFIP